jgi:hypothetical protein
VLGYGYLDHGTRVLTEQDPFGRPRGSPGWLIRLASPYLGALMVDTSMRVSHEKATRELGWTPTTPTYRDGIRAPSG